jgi:hypothetical protein
MQKYDVKLHDIKPIVDVPDHSYMLFVLLIIVSVLLFLALLYLLYRYFKNHKKVNIRKEHYKILDSLDMKDSKKTAYMLTKYGATFSDDSNRHKQMYKNLTDRLAKYKYKKSVEEFDDETLGYIELYKGMIDV